MSYAGEYFEQRLIILFLENNIVNLYKYNKFLRKLRECWKSSHFWVEFKLIYQFIVFVIEFILLF